MDAGVEAEQRKPHHFPGWLQGHSASHGNATLPHGFVSIGRCLDLDAPGKTRRHEVNLRKSRSAAGSRPPPMRHTRTRTAREPLASCTRATRLEPRPKSGRHSRSSAMAGSVIDARREARAGARASSVSTTSTCESRRRL